MANELPLGARRVGDFVDFYPETPLVNVTLERSDSGISVTIPWSDRDSDHARWFTDGIGMEVPPRPDPLPVPKRVSFRDSHGDVLLIRCRARGFHTRAFGRGSGTLWARAAILGPRENLEFESPHGLQTEISGLRGWLGITSWKEEQNIREPPFPVRISSEEPAAVQIGEHQGIALEFRPSWLILREEAGDRRVLLDVVRSVTRSVDPVPWDKHRQVHQAIRDLLVLSRWRNESCVEVLVRRDDDLMRTVDGKEHGGYWREVVVPKDERASEPTGYRPHLIRYEELKEPGVLNWLQLRNHFARALDPVISSIALHDATPNTMLAHTGPGLEALGYLLMIRDGVSKNKAGRANLTSRFERILLDLGDCLPFDGSAWVASAVETYNSLKHANREEPDGVDVINAWRESVMVVRAWVALELGVSAEDVKDRLDGDPQRHAYVKVE